MLEAARAQWKREATEAYAQAKAAANRAWKDAKDAPTGADPTQWREQKYAECIQALDTALTLNRGCDVLHRYHEKGFTQSTR